MPEHPEIQQAKLRIDVLLKEYDTLRAEILQRINARFTIVGLLGALVAFLLSKWEWQPRNTLLDMRWAVAALGVAVVLVIWYRFGTLIKNLGARVSSVEQRVNQLAGDELLTWETRYGWGRFRHTRKRK